ncbi:hypothetical protein BC939DRAFT_474828 [Gamsiella multidivaricata]|uniref:uncharacterized protein n=1 Tax=Gamsiella multidivaricata TaxID=101098 RepID=UPI00221EF391|nr:uncharacterized protein BC939DRAFT_474828 [Gamsiella multidivaricata]KAG0368577.1 hypothetical protein BGZ54_001658 [Gamsiella multidivaricata]KAI7828665.1 hypothetical protein BC939DRAFT_474828 [Gamsiella multidivaricata]
MSTSPVVDTPSVAQNTEPEVVDVNAVADIIENLEITPSNRMLLPTIDLDAELKSVQERLEAIAKEEREGADAERVALEELEKSTVALVAVRTQLKEKQEQLDSLDQSDNSRSDLQSEVDQLAQEAVQKEHQWSATKEVCSREYGPIVDSHAAPVTEVKAKAQHDIKMLQEQIASLQKQLDAVSIRRKQMAADAEEQHRKLAEQGPGIDDDDEVDA